MGFLLKTHSVAHPVQCCVKVLQQRYSEGGPKHALPPLSKYEILGLETPEHTDGWIHFPELIETVSELSRSVWDPLTPNPGF